MRLWTQLTLMMSLILLPYQAFALEKVTSQQTEQTSYTLNTNLQMDTWDIYLQNGEDTPQNVTMFTQRENLITPYSQPKNDTKGMRYAARHMQYGFETFGQTLGLNDDWSEAFGEGAMWGVIQAAKQLPSEDWGTLRSSLLDDLKAGSDTSQLKALGKGLVALSADGARYLGVPEEYATYPALGAIGIASALIKDEVDLPTFTDPIWGGRVNFTIEDYMDGGTDGSLSYTNTFDSGRGAVRFNAGTDNSGNDYNVGFRLTWRF
jgi:hypothetical protein